MQFFCFFLKILAKSYVGAPWRIGAPPAGNPGCAPEDDIVLKKTFFCKCIVFFKSTKQNWAKIKKKSSVRVKLLQVKYGKYFAIFGNRKLLFSAFSVRALGNYWLSKLELK